MPDRDRDLGVKTAGYRADSCVVTPPIAIGRLSHASKNPTTQPPAQPSLSQIGCGVSYAGIWGLGIWSFVGRCRRRFHAPHPYKFAARILTNRPSHERIDPTFGDWCNGSTSASGALCLGSNPRSPAFWTGLDDTQGNASTPAKPGFNRYSGCRGVVQRNRIRAENTTYRLD